MPEWQIERLARAHDRSAFSCGKPALDEFLRRYVSQYEKRRLGRTFVAVRAGTTRVFGYDTLASSKIAFRNLPGPASRNLPAHPVPTVLLARLAVDRTLQGQGLGEALLVDALRRCCRLGDELGVHAIEVDALDPAAKRFYEKYGFTPLIDAESHVFLPIATLYGALTAE
jgi:GNAT superfamily N-acetyltransferase